MIDFTFILGIGYIIVLIITLFNYFNRDKIARRYIIKNNIQAQVESRIHFEDSDKLQLLTALINDIDFNNLEKWQIDGFKEIIDTKINANT